MTTSGLCVGPYVLHEKLGSHRRHHVYRAVHQTTGQQFAVKLVNISTRIDRSLALKKLQLEVKILQRLEHERLVRTLDAGVVDNKLYFVMELVEGESLAAILSRRGKLPWDLAIEYGRQIAEGLNYLHDQDLVHLKLNPDKILITPDGKVKIADLRLNRARKRRWDETKRRVLDIAAYMAAEQMTDEGGSEKSDLYTLGVLLYEMITGKLPYEPETLPRLLKAKQEQTAPRLTSVQLDCPVWVDNIVAQLLANRPSDRPHESFALLASIKEVQRMHTEGRSVAEEMTRGFNPLTAGRDKTEAYRVLGQQREQDPAKGADRWKIALIAAGLLFTMSLTAFLLWFTLRPLSEQQLYENAIAAMDGDISERTLLRAKRNLEPLLERFPEGEYASEANALYDDVLAHLAERRMHRRYRQGITPKLESERLTAQAWQLEELGDPRRALEVYESARDLELVDGDDNALGFRKLAERQVKVLTTRLEEHEASLVDRRDNLIEKLDRAAQLEEDGKLVESRSILRTLIDSFDDDDDVADLVDRAKAMIDEERAAEDRAAEDRAVEDGDNRRDDEIQSSGPEENMSGQAIDGQNDRVLRYRHAA